ncbi:hypothetical protein E2562_013573 [Oryza meyeriana var. granulata]|uniref:Uncharacterized protein n=1 Tax=Oryza meyeriana var. granulata TaxID=110450 RepID=A0A6G1C7B7_9ORYZ|nr:hypothetical protein E2562_013573 [Oryza meyeriana var. granulata]
MGKSKRIGGDGYGKPGEAVGLTDMGRHRAAGMRSAAVARPMRGTDLASAALRRAFGGRRGWARRLARSSALAVAIGIASQLGRLVLSANAKTASEMTCHR